MSYNFDFNKVLNVGYSLQPQTSHTNNYITNYSGAKLFADYMYNKDNNFYNIFNDIFKTTTNSPQLIKSFRYYPFDISAYMDLLIYQKSSMTIAGKTLIDVFHGEPAKYIDFTYANNVFLLGDFTVPYFEDIDSFLSYEPYTYIKLYLPFYSTLIDIDAKRIKERKIFVHGALDFKDGDIVYIVTTADSEFLGSYRAHITIDLPLYYQDLAGYIERLARNVMGGIGNAVTNFGGALGNVVNTQFTRIDTMQGTQGSLDSFRGYYSPNTPNLLVYKPRVKYSLNNTSYNHIIGVPTRKITRLSNMGGFTKVLALHNKDITGATYVEIDEIERLLTEGIIIDNTSATFSINFTGSHISWNYQPTTLQYGSPLSTTYTIESGYQLDSIKVYMGGNDITSTAVSGNVVVISQVTGNVSIVTEASKVPVTYTITSNLNGATLTNSAITVLEGDSYSTGIEPNYNTGHIGKNYEPDVYIGGVPYTSGVSTFEVIVDSVTSNIVIEGTYPSVSTMNVSNWSMRSGTVNLPANVETATGVRITTSLGQVESTGSVVFDNSLDTLFNNAFISFEGNVIGGASNVTIGMNQTGNVFYLDGQNNIVNVGYITNLQFLDTDSWTTQATLLEYMDKNFMYNG